jgi:glycosyltransferase involved in cell wall biosynthesis
MSNNLRISVCLATYNGERFIEQQLVSILKQIGKEDEVIISDDSSNDRTIEIIKGFNDNRINILLNNKFYSPIYNLENALKNAKGDFVFLADQDDIWYNSKVERTLLLLSDYDLVLSNCSLVNANGELIKDSFFPKAKRSIGSIIYNIYNNPYIGCCMAFNINVLKKALPFPKRLGMHDSWIGLLAQFYFKTYYIKEPLVYYRRHGNNASPSGEKSKYSLCFKFRYRARLIYNILLRFF